MPDITVAHVLYGCLTLLGTAFVALAGYMAKRLYKTVDNLCQSIEALNGTIASFKNWVLEEFVTKDDHKSDIAAVNLRISDINGRIND
jgi:hypothetical protein